MTSDSRQPGYLELISGNINFRRLWLGNVVSLLGDWFNFIALIALVEELTGSPFAVGLIFVTKMLPGAIASPFAGYLVDRFDRRRIMIVCDVLRSVTVLGLLLVDDSSKIYLVYVLTTVQVIISAVFHPAQSASIPNVTSKTELLTANAIMSISWSVMLALGAAIGGLATDIVGPRDVFVIDSVTYLVSAWFIFRTEIPQSISTITGRFWRQSLREVRAGWEYLRQNRFCGKIATTKATWAIAGGGLVYMLALAGQQLIEGSPEIGIGVLFAARGIGTGVGPVLARAWVTDRSRWPPLLGICVVSSGLAYLLFGLLAWTIPIAFLVGIAHSTSGATWVLSSVTLQEKVEDRFRGRVFATEMLLVLVAETVSTLVAALALQYEILSIRQAIIVFAATMTVTGALWTVWILRR
ncbi:MAG: MFS transporter [Rhodothermales bacterium]|nr:MFS transporter [Rhodothermales bacterium]